MISGSNNQFLRTLRGAVAVLPHGTLDTAEQMIIENKPKQEVLTFIAKKLNIKHESAYWHYNKIQKKIAAEKSEYKDEYVPKMTKKVVKKIKELPHYAKKDYFRHAATAFDEFEKYPLVDLMAVYRESHEVKW